MSLRPALRGVAVPQADADALAARALAAGRALETRRLRRRGALRVAGGAALAVATVTAYATVTTSAPPAQAAIACTAHGVTLAGGTVRAGDAGARLVVTNATGDVVPLVVGDVATFVPPGRSSVNVPSRPGRVTVSCGAGQAALTVTGGRWADDRVDCAAPRVEDLRGVSEPVAGDPVALTRAALALPHGVGVEPAGYPGATDRRLVRVVDGDRAVALAVWRALPDGVAWTLDEVRRCESLALA